MTSVKNIFILVLMLLISSAQLFSSDAIAVNGRLIDDKIFILSSNGVVEILCKDPNDLPIISNISCYIMSNGSVVAHVPIEIKENNNGVYKFEQIQIAENSKMQWRIYIRFSNSKVERLYDLYLVNSDLSYDK